MKTKIILAFIVILAIFLRFHALGEVPVGIHADGAAQGYNAFSLLTTGKDMYGKKYPIMFRANGSYQPPIYTYLTMIPVYLFGNTLFSARFVSAFSGVLAVLLTYAIVDILRKKFTKVGVDLPLISALVVAVSPQIIYFNRLTVEASLSFMLFTLGTYIFLKSLENIRYLPISLFVYGIGTHAYYSERIVSIAFVAILLFIFRKTILKNKKILLAALAVFVITQIPHLYLSSTGAFARRFEQVSYIGDILAKNESIAAKGIEIGAQFIDHYMLYFSPSNLFFDMNNDLGRTSPDLGAFYVWFFFPAIIGIWYLFRNWNSAGKVITGLTLISLLPAALTGDDFYPLRVIIFMWCIALIVSFGIYEIWVHLRRGRVAVLLLGVLFASSLAFFWISYFGIFKYEAAEAYGYPYIKLMDELPRYRDKKIIVDASPRAWGAGIRLAYLLYADPTKMQENLSSQLATPYFSEVVNANEVYRIGNIKVKPLDWREICDGNYLLVGDNLSISEAQVNEHHLTPEFAVEDLIGRKLLFAYSTPETDSCGIK